MRIDVRLLLIDSVNISFQILAVPRYSNSIRRKILRRYRDTAKTKEENHSPPVPDVNEGGSHGHVSCWAASIFKAKSWPVFFFFDSGGVFQVRKGLRLRPRLLFVLELFQLGTFEATTELPTDDIRYDMEMTGRKYR